MFGSFLPSLWSLSNQSLLGSRSRHCYAIKYVRAQTAAPEVVKRIVELENSLWRLADAATQSNKGDEDPALRTAIEEARFVLNNRLEVDDTKHRFHSELSEEPFQDDLSLFNK